MADPVVVVDYETANLHSVSNALRRLGCEHVVTADPEVVRAAARAIFPGVGGAGAAMSVIRQRGLEAALRDVYTSGRPLLGICIGCHIAFEHSEEDDTACMGFLPGMVRRHPGKDARGAILKVPHMGWNAVHFRVKHPLFQGVPDGSAFYFVHSYYVEAVEPRDVLATVEYGMELPAVVGRDNLVATQFHLEKSGEVGLAMLERFLRWDGRCS